MWPTVICSVILAAIFTAIVVCGIRNKKKGKGSCSCGCSCGTCGMNCHAKGEDSKK